MKYHFSKNWIYFKNKLFCFNLSNPFKTIRKLKGVFKPLKCKFWFGKRCNVPLFYYGVHTGLLFDLTIRDVSWKDKYDTPRLEECPFIAITLFNKYSFVWRWLTDDKFQDDYWEQALWYLYYCEPLNIEKAKESWPWEDYETKQSSWNDKYLVE